MLRHHALHSHVSPVAGSWTPPRVGVCVRSDDAAAHAHARLLARELGLPIVGEKDAGCDLLLLVTAQGLELQATGRAAPGAVRAGLGAEGGGARRLAAASRRQPLARAVGLQKRTPTVVDATAGWGRDAAVLAKLGCPVLAIERSPVLAAMLRDALDRLHDCDWRTRITLRVGDAAEILEHLSVDRRPDVVYLDPMFPPRGKAARPKKDLYVLRRLVGDDPDAARLLETARRVARQRVVVKRAPHLPPLAPEPNTSIRSKLLRFDVYFV